MQAILIAWSRAARSLMRGDILWHMLWPTGLAFAIWIAVGAMLWGEAAQIVLHYVQAWPAVGGWFADGSGAALVLAGFAHLLLVLLFLPLSLFTATFLITVFALPLMLDRIAATDYPDIAERRGGSQIGSITNALLALLIFLPVAALSIPFWFIPGMGIVLSILFSAWLNQRCYRYDALMRHADEQELATLPRQHRGALWGIGMTGGVLAFVPLLNFFVPALCGLAFVHYLLQVLRDTRGSHLV